MSRVTHFEISADDPVKMRAFYQNVFGWNVTKWEGPIDYWLASTGDPESTGIDGALWPNALTHGTVVTVEVENLDAAVEKVQRHRGEIITEKTTITGIGYQIHCKDIERNIIGIHQTDPNAGE